MSETERLIHAYFAAFNARDPESLLATLAGDVVHDINEGPTEVGIEAFRRFRAHMDERYLETIEDLFVMTNGDRGAAEFTVSGTYLKTDGPFPEATGQAYTIPAAAFFEVREGKIARVTSYNSLKGWTDAIS